MFRLWNLLDGRCTYKRKIGIDPETQKVEKSIAVKWEPKNGLMYAILYEKRLEVYKTESDQPITHITSDVKFISMDFVSENEIVVTDSLGKFTLVKGIES